MKTLIPVILFLITQSLFADEINFEVKAPFPELENRMEMQLTDEFVQFLYNYNPVQEVTCYNNDTFINTVIKYEEPKINVDKSVTNEWPKIERGGKEFILSWQGTS